MLLRSVVGCVDLLLRRPRPRLQESELWLRVRELLAVARRAQGGYQWLSRWVVFVSIQALRKRMC